MTTSTLEVSESVHTAVGRRTDPAVSGESAKGLCSTCGNAQGCTLHGAGGRPVLQCDEIEPLEFSTARSTGIPGPDRFRPVAETTALGRGLCVNCDRGVDCLFPRPAEGVWRCEEYT